MKIVKIECDGQAIASWDSTDADSAAQHLAGWMDNQPHEDILGNAYRCVITDEGGVEIDQTGD